MVKSKLKVKAVLFDLDQTLIDFMVIKRAAAKSAVKEMRTAGLKMPQARAEKILFKLYDEYGIENQRIFQIFLKKVLGRIDYKMLAAGISAYRKVKATMFRPYPNVLPTLKKLRARGLKLGLVSDAPRLQAWTRLADLGLLNMFDVVVTIGDVKRRKPSPLPFRAALAALKLKPHKVLMVGDWPARDVAGAARLGMKTCLAKYGMSSWNRGGPRADFEITNISELLKIV